MKLCLPDEAAAEVDTPETGAAGAVTVTPT